MTDSRDATAWAAGSEAIVPEPPTGAQFLVERARQQAVVTELGAALRSWHVDDRQLLDTFAMDEAGEDFRGRVLAPWPNRIRDGRYAFAGSEHRIPITEPERNCALHGLVRCVKWQPVRRSSDHVTLGYVLRPQPGYPFTLRLEVEYRLALEGLTLTLCATNLGAAVAPFGAGFHPYLSLGDRRIDDYVLEMPARTRVPVDERLLPRGAPVPVDGTRHDFRRARSIGAQALDTCFGDLERGADGLARVRLTDAEGARAVTAWMDEHFRYVHVYTADAVTDAARRRGGLAIEPMTCAPDAFNSGEGLVALRPGASFTCRWGLSTRREEP
ncbi:MAG: aldose 1-epimerase family protein [Solirubrobacteraceae bacterium]